MKKILYVIFTGFALFLLTGCSVDYNLLITNKKRIIENVTLLDENDNILKYNDSIEYFLLYREKNFTSLGYKSKNLIGKEFSGLYLTKEYDNFNDYIGTSIMNNLFEKANVEENENLFIFETSGKYLYNDVFSLDIMSDYLYKLDEINVKIKFYNKVVNHNADFVDEKNNIYTWILSKDNSYDNIMFQLSNDVRIDVMFWDYIRRYKVTLLVVGLVIIVLVFGIFSLKKVMKKNNSI